MKVALWISLGLTALFVFLTSEVLLYIDYPMYHAYRLQVMADRALLIPHVFFGTFALLSGPLQFSSRFRQRHLAWHRILGRLYALSVLVSAPTGVLLSRGRPGFPGTFMQASAWVVCTAAAVITARNRHIVEHRQWMARSYAVTFTFVSSRVLNLSPRIQPVEDGIANLCCVVQQPYLARLGFRWENFLSRMQRDCPHLAMRLADAEPLLDKPIAITHLPYGYIRRTTEDALYCIGDQAAVIPSFTGDGISIALHTARCAVAAFLGDEPAPLFQARLRSELRAQMRLAEFAADGLNNRPARAVLPFGLRVWPGAMRMTARLTRVTQPRPPAVRAGVDQESCYAESR